MSSFLFTWYFVCLSVGFMGLSLSYALTLSSAQANLTRFYSNLENYIISVERIKQFMNIPPEPPAIIVNNRPPSIWPAEGRIDLENLHVCNILLIIWSLYSFLQIETNFYGASNFKSPCIIMERPYINNSAGFY